MDPASFFPCELVQRIASFLPASDLLKNVSVASKQWHACLSLGVIPPRLLYSRLQKNTTSRVHHNNDNNNRQAAAEAAAEGRPAPPLQQQDNEQEEDEDEIPKEFCRLPLTPFIDDKYEDDEDGNCNENGSLKHNKVDNSFCPSNQRFYRGSQSPTDSTSNIHSILISSAWCDQGWGNQKGQIYVVAKRQRKEENAESALEAAGEDKQQQSEVDKLKKAFNGGRLVYESGIAPHALSHLAFSFVPRRGENYFLFVKVGGGGGHLLHIRDLKIGAVVFDDAARSVSRTVRKLLQFNVIPWGFELNSSVPAFYTNLLIRTCQSLKHQLLVKTASAPSNPQQQRQHDTATTLDPLLIEVFDEIQIPITERTLTVVQEIITRETKTRLQLQADFNQQMAAAAPGALGATAARFHRAQQQRANAQQQQQQQQGAQQAMGGRLAPQQLPRIHLQQLHHHPPGGGGGGGIMDRHRQVFAHRAGIAIPMQHLPPPHNGRFVLPNPPPQQHMAAHPGHPFLHHHPHQHPHHQRVLEIPNWGVPVQVQIQPPQQQQQQGQPQLQIPQPPPQQQEQQQQQQEQQQEGPEPGSVQPMQQQQQHPNQNPNHHPPGIRLMPPGPGNQQQRQQQQHQHVRIVLPGAGPGQQQQHRHQHIHLQVPNFVQRQQQQQPHEAQQQAQQQQQQQQQQPHNLQEQQQQQHEGGHRIIIQHGQGGAGGPIQIHIHHGLTPQQQQQQQQRQQQNPNQPLQQPPRYMDLN